MAAPLGMLLSPPWSNCYATAKLQTLCQLSKLCRSNLDMVSFAVWFPFTFSALITHSFTNILSLPWAHWLAHIPLNALQVFGFSDFFFYIISRAWGFVSFPLSCKSPLNFKFFTKGVPSFCLSGTFLGAHQHICLSQMDYKGRNVWILISKANCDVCHETVIIHTSYLTILGSHRVWWQSPGQVVTEWELEPYFSPG